MLSIWASSSFCFKSHPVLICFLLAFCLNLSVFSQLTNDLFFERITTEEGLAHKVILGMIQDSRGFIWIATSNGLQRYDGYEFKTYRQDFRNPKHSLANNVIYGTIEDGHQNIWAYSAAGGVTRINPVNNAITTFSFQLDTTLGLLFDKTRDMAIDSRGTIWLVTEGGLFYFNEENQQFKKHIFDFFVKDASRQEMNAMAADRWGKLWIAAADRLLYFDPLTGVCQHSDYNPDSLKLLEIELGGWNIFIDKSDVLWVSRFHGAQAYRYDFNQNILEDLVIKSIDGVTADHSKMRFMEDSRGNFGSEAFSTDCLNKTSRPE